MEKSKITINDHQIIDRIYLIRNQKVMLDTDLALLYDVETKRINEQVKRNSNRFPKDFMFQLTKDEWKLLKSQNATSSWGGRRTLPYVFTEHGVLMLSSILKSNKAVEVNIQIMRIFIKMREIISDNLNLKLEIEEIKKKLSNHTKNIELVFNYLDELIEKKDAKRPKIGYKK